MPDGDQEFGQLIYLAQMFAQKGTCECQGCQLIRKATEGMAARILGKGYTAQVPGIQEAISQALQTPAAGGEPGKEG